MSLEQLVVLLISSGALTPLVVSLTHYLLSKLPARQVMMAEKVVSLAVPAVEQLYASMPGSGAQKKAEVEKLALAELSRLGIKVSPALLEVLIESAVSYLPKKPA